MKAPLPGEGSSEVEPEWKEGASYVKISEKNASHRWNKYKGPGPRAQTEGLYHRAEGSRRKDDVREVGRS